MKHWPFLTNAFLLLATFEYRPVLRISSTHTSTMHSLYRITEVYKTTYLHKTYVTAYWPIFSRSPCLKK